MRDLIERTKMDVLTTDSGSEFVNNKVKELLNKQGIEHYVAEPEDHTRMGMIERFNKSIKDKLEKYFVSSNKYNWVDQLPNILQNYNDLYKIRNLYYKLLVYIK